MTNKQKAKELIEIIDSHFWHKGEDRPLYHYPRNQDFPEFGELWDYAAYAMAVSSYALRSREETAVFHMKRVLDRMELFRADDKTARYYLSQSPDKGMKEPYYDDNAWCALALCFAYEAAKDMRYLLTAKEIMRYIYGGWNEKQGGIRWKEFYCDTTNACSTGGALIVSLKIYQAAGEQEYFVWAQKLYYWMRGTLRDTDGLYWDGIKTDGSIDKIKYSYNAGIMIWAGALLYGITGHNEYLEDAKRSAQAAVKEWLPSGVFTCDCPWFCSFLIEGFIALNKHADMSGTLSAIQALLDKAQREMRTKQGFYWRDWILHDPANTEKHEPICHKGLYQYGVVSIITAMTEFKA